MFGKKRLNKTRHSALILEARAGLIPESDWIAEEVRARMDRTARISRVVKFHARLLTSGSHALAISEILADLRHYCDSKGLAFEQLDAAACENFEEEASQSRMVGCLPN
jgi:glycerol-3-phosphate O-acyltransferase